MPDCPMCEQPLPLRVFTVDSRSTTGRTQHITQDVRRGGEIRAICGRSFWISQVYGGNRKLRPIRSEHELDKVTRGYFHSCVQCRGPARLRLRCPATGA